MELTSFTIKQVEGLPRLKGYARVAFDHQLVINKVKIIQAEHGLCIEFPKEPDTENERYETIALLDNNLRSQMQTLVSQALKIRADYFLAEKSA